MNVAQLADDLMAERHELLSMLTPLSGTELGIPTPAPGWTIHDQVTHLAWFDAAARKAIDEPEAFRRDRDAVIEDIDGFVAQVTDDGRRMNGADAIAWLRREGDELVQSAVAADPNVRVPWYGPDMTVASCITARIMEIWAHGQDVADALNVTRAESRALPHVAFIGWRAVANSFRAHGEPVPDAPVRVELGDVVLGPDDADDVVRGSLLDFCLVVTQRRHRADTTLVAHGPVATRLLDIAQAFAGPPGAGRQPGQFQ